VETSLYKDHFELEEWHWWFTARAEIVLALLEPALPMPSGRRPRILDIGCGTGGMLERMARLGDVTGIDTSDEALDYCRKRGIASVHRYGEFRAEGRAFDAVTLFDVIEHADDDVGLLREARGFLAPGGIVLVTVPAFPFLWSRHDDLNHHRRRYVKRTLRAAFEGAGLDLVRLTYFNSLLFPAVVLVRGVARILPRGSAPAAESSDLRRGTGLLNAPLRRLFASEKHFLRRIDFPAGTSLLAIARAR
jgi:SAM-dependent methyltransferase